MEKFAVDLDKVLDEFEFNEDRAEQMVTINRKGCGSSSAEIGGVSHHSLQALNTQHGADFTPLNCFSSELISSSSSSILPARMDVDSSGSSSSIKNNVEHSQSASLYWQQDLVIQNVNMERSPSNNKLNVSGVFSSLNEYLNAGSINVSAASRKDGSDWVDKTVTLNYTEISNDSNSSRNNKIHLQNIFPSEGVDNNHKYYYNVNDGHLDNKNKPQNDAVCSSEMEGDFGYRLNTGTESDLQEGRSTSTSTFRDETHTLDLSYNLSNAGNPSVYNEHTVQQLKSKISDSKLSWNCNLCSADTNSENSFVPVEHDCSDIHTCISRTTNQQNQNENFDNCSNDSSFNKVASEAEILKDPKSRSEINLCMKQTKLSSFDLVGKSVTDETENRSCDPSFSLNSSEINDISSVSLKSVDIVKMSEAIPNLNEESLKTLSNVDQKISKHSPSSSHDTKTMVTVTNPVSFNTVEEFSKDELHSYLQELEEMGSNMILYSSNSVGELGGEVQYEKGKNVFDPSQFGDDFKIENSAVLTNFLMVEASSQGSKHENPCPQGSCVQPSERDVTEFQNSEGEYTPSTLVDSETVGTCNLEHAKNSEKVDMPKQYLSIANNKPNTHDIAVDFPNNTNINVNGVLIPKGEPVPCVGINSTAEPPDNCIRNELAKKTNGENINATISISMLNTGKSTANVTNVISIECQQTKNCTEVLSIQDTSNMLESTLLTNIVSETGETEAAVMNSNANDEVIQSLEANNILSNEEKSILLSDLSSSLVQKELPSNEAELFLKYALPNERNIAHNLSEKTMIMENGYTSTVVGGCLVQAPKDGSRINVLGEEERPSRPKFLFLPSKITLENQPESSEILDSVPQRTSLGLPGETPVAHLDPSEDIPNGTAVNTLLESTENAVLTSPDISENSSIEVAISPVPSIQTTSPSNNESLPYILSPEERSLGKLPPFWVPDGDAPNCMLCDLKFTVLKRRHHCRACGKVFCSKCCSLKSRLEYMENAEARVCQPCFDILARVLLTEQGESASESPSSLPPDSGSTPLGRQPNPNNPMEYCSTIPPLEQAASTSPQPVPSVLVPVGVLKREGSTRSKSDVTKQVMFSDGIRPGGDLTELDGSSEPRLPYRRQERILKRVGTPPGVPSNTSHHSALRSLLSLEPKTKSYIPSKGLPPLATLVKGEVKLEEITNLDKLLASLRLETDPAVMFALNRNLFVKVKILNLDCCVNRLCWCFSTMGMSSVGQDEIVIILECLPEETTIPRDIFCHLNTIYQEASRGSMVSEMGHTVFQGPLFLGSSEHGGFIYIRPSFQCLHKLVLPSAPYLVAILFHRWEIPWAKVFPIRLMLRLGAEYRYYPCMLVSIRQRKPVYCEIGHTIINLLADFRNLSYTLPSVRGLVIHMEDRHTSILLPKNRYDQVARALNNSNDHVLALAANFSLSADSHLVCIQSHGDESYHTQAINIHNKPRKVTGASFVVFNGALKLSSNLTAKSSIVEDGLMVQITPDTIQELRTALRKMQDFSVRCGPAGAVLPDELVNIKWVQDDRNFNIGVVSFIDGLALDGVPSIRVHNGTDYMGTIRFIRWTEVFILQSGENSERSGDPLDISRLSESLARATCLALVNYLDLLAQAGLTKIAVRANIHPENVGYEAGSHSEKLPPIYMKSLDNELVPVLHKAASMAPESPPVLLELIFHVMLQ